MSAIASELDTEAGPPTAVPLGHFVVGLLFLVAGVAAGGIDGRGGHLAQTHLLVAGWVCLTIFGAMTQFVPAWSGVELHSRRLAVAQLPLAAAGVIGLAAGFAGSVAAILPVAGVLFFAGICAFAYNLGRTLRGAGVDRVTAHFACALGFFLLLAVAGVGLALDHAVGVLPVAGVSRPELLGSHVTLAVFGAVFCTVCGALAQLGPMFTQAERTRLGRVLERAETAVYPVGVVLLAGGRLFGLEAVARSGGLLVVFGLSAVAVALAWRLGRARTERTPMLTRYAVGAAAVLGWAPPTAVSWWNAPLEYDGLLGHPDASFVLLVGGIGFVVLGTLYHVVPFIVWVHRYSDRLGFEPVPMVEDLYDGRVAAVDGGLLVVACALAAVPAGAGGWIGPWIPPERLNTVGGAAAFLGVALVAANLLGVLLRHGVRSPPADEGGRGSPDGDER